MSAGKYICAKCIVEHKLKPLLVYYEPNEIPYLNSGKCCVCGETKQVVLHPEAGNIKHPGGRPPIFSSPDEMMLRFEEYKLWCKENPILHNESIKSGDSAGQYFQVPHARPLTIWGFSAYCKCSRQGFLNYGSDDRHKEFFDTFEQICTEMAAQTIEGAMCGSYNANLTARIHGITEKTDVEHRGLKEPPREMTVRLVRNEDVELTE